MLNGTKKEELLPPIKTMPKKQKEEELDYVEIDAADTHSNTADGQEDGEIIDDDEDLGLIKITKARYELKKLEEK